MQPWAAGPGLDVTAGGGEAPGAESHRARKMLDSAEARIAANDIEGAARAALALAAQEAGVRAQGGALAHAYRGAAAACLAPAGPPPPLPVARQQHALQQQRVEANLLRLQQAAAQLAPAPAPRGLSAGARRERELAGRWDSRDMEGFIGDIIQEDLAQARAAPAPAPAPAPRPAASGPAPGHVPYPTLVPVKVAPGRNPAMSTQDAWAAALAGGAAAAPLRSAASLGQVSTGVKLELAAPATAARPPRPAKLAPAGRAASAPAKGSPKKKGPKRKAVSMDPDEEEKEQKRQERMAKNRLSAKQSRERRLAHDETLKATIAKLTEEKEFHLAVKEGHNPLVKTGLDHSLISGDLKRSVTLSRYKSM